MNPKFLFFAAFVFICSHSFAQDAQISETNTAIESTTPFKKCSSTCKKKDVKKNTTAYSNREWRKIKREMKENRKNRTASSKKEHIVSKRVLDTVVLEAPSFNRQSQVSSW